jgi:hypothetical protein
MDERDCALCFFPATVTGAGKEIEYANFKICAMGAGMLCLTTASLVHGIPRCVRNDALSLL